MKYAHFYLYTIYNVFKRNTFMPLVCACARHIALRSPTPQFHACALRIRQLALHAVVQRRQLQCPSLFSADSISRNRTKWYVSFFIADAILCMYKHIFLYCFVLWESA